jgi:uncharacterized membrane protein required for colicin V production
MNTYDILMLAFILLGALHGYRKGLLTGLAQIGGVIIGFFIASMLYLQAMNWLKQFLPLQTWLESFIYKLILPSLQVRSGVMTQQGLDKFLTTLPPDLKHYLAASNVLGGQPTANVTQGYLENIAHSISVFISDKILALLAFVLILFAVAILIQALVNILFAPLGIFRGTLNRVGGTIFGIIGTFLILAVISGIILPLMELNTQSSGLLMLQRSFLLPYLLQTFQMLREMLSLPANQDIQASLGFLLSNHL